MRIIEIRRGIGKLRIVQMTEAELVEWRARVRRVMAKVNYGAAQLDEALGYSSEGRLTKTYLGEYRGTEGRRPSFAYYEHFEEFAAQVEEGIIEPIPPWRPVPIWSSEGKAIPLDRILAAAHQCPYCVYEWLIGMREEAETWWWVNSPTRVYCSERHRRGWRVMDPALREETLAAMDAHEAVRVRAAMARWREHNGETETF